jgi:hypothetical protein
MTPFYVGNQYLETEMKQEQYEKVKAEMRAMCYAAGKTKGADYTRSVKWRSPNGPRMSDAPDDLLGMA